MLLAKTPFVIRLLTRCHFCHPNRRYSSAYPVTRLLAQTLSNLVTRNDALSDESWSVYLDLPEEQLILTCVFNTVESRIRS